MSHSNSSTGLRWLPIVLSVSLGTLQGCTEGSTSLEDDNPQAAAESGLVTAYSVTLQEGTNGYTGTRDTYLSQSATATNYGAKTTLYADGDAPTGTGRDLSALLHFDTSSIPSNAVVTNVTLSLYVTDPSSKAYPIYAANRTWNEGEATWVTAQTGTNWQIAGAFGALDRDACPLGSIVSTSTGSKTFGLNAAGLAEVQTWIASPVSNFGLVIASSTIADKLAFYSGEYGTVSRRPKLVISYTITTPDCVAPGCCLTDVACSDANACTIDTCVNGACDYSAVAGCCNSGSECSDDNSCTTDACVSNACVYSPVTGCCASDQDCNDSRDCTNDSCVSNTCVYSPVTGCCASDQDCNDTRDCTVDSCVAGSCSYTETSVGACGCQNDADCGDNNPCTIDSCQNGTCNNTLATCSDGDPTTTDTCVDGSCSHSVPVTITKTFRNGENAYSGASDTKLAQYYPTTNYDTATILVVDGDEPSGGGNDVTTLLKWDNLGIPSDAEVTSAAITLYIGGGTNAASANAYPLYAVNSAWTAAQATWTLADSGRDWATSGASGTLDRDATAIGSTPASVSGTVTITLNAAGVAKVQSWVGDPLTNHGIAFASSTNTDGLSFYSSEYATLEYRPRLSVTYTGRQTLVDPVPVSSSGNGPRYGFFVYSDSHVDAAANTWFSRALAQMNELMNADGAPPIIAAISTGDHTENGLDASWDWHTALTAPYWDANATSFGGTQPRYIATPGNHDLYDATNWLTYWSEHLPGQAALQGNSSTAGVYYSFSYENALFVGLDTNKATNTSTSYQNDPQLQMLRSTLGTSASAFKFVFYHMPAFYCGSGGMGANPSSLAFVDLAAQNDVDVVFNGHSHVYSRTCRMMKNHACTGTTDGTVQVEVGTVGATDARLRALNTAAQSVTGYDASGTSDSTAYTCASAGGYARTLGSQRSFCYVNVRGCWAKVNCYQVGNTTPFDSWILNHCQ